MLKTQQKEDNKLVDKITELSQKIEELEALISKLCEAFMNWTDQLVDENSKQQPDKQPQPTYIN